MLSRCTFIGVQETEEFLSDVVLLVNKSNGGPQLLLIRYVSHFIFRNTEPSSIFVEIIDNFSLNLLANDADKVILDRLRCVCGILRSIQKCSWKVASPPSALYRRRSFKFNFSTSISQTFRSWVAIFHLRQPIAFYLTAHTVCQGLLLLWMFYSKGGATFI